MDKESKQQVREAYKRAEAARPWLAEGTLSGLAEQSSSWNPAWRSGKVSGLIPVSDSDLQRFGVDESEMTDWKKNLRVGVTMLDENYSRFGNAALALLAMRVGPGRVNDIIDGNVDITELSKSEREFLPSVVARSSKYGGVVQHQEIASVADLVGVDDLTPIYRKAGIARPELPENASGVGDGSDSNTRQALESLAGQEDYVDEDTGERVIGVDQPRITALFDAPGLPEVEFNRIEKPEVLAEPSISPRIAAAFGVTPTTKLGPQIDKVIDDLWDQA